MSEFLDRLPPQALDVERTVLGSMLVDSHAAAMALELLDENCFYSSANRQIFTSMREMAKKNFPIDLLTLSDVLRKKRIVEETGGAAYLGEICESIVVAANIEYYIGILREKSDLRVLLDAGHYAEQHAFDPDASALEIGERLRTTIDKITAGHSFLKNVFVPTLYNAPPEGKAVVELSNVKILSPGNITMMTAGAGTGKTSALEAGCSSAISPMCNSLGIRFNADSILYIDTERSTADFYRSWRRFLRRAEVDQPPENIRWENIRGIDSLGERLRYLSARIEIGDPPDLVIIDGIGDFVSDPNDSVEVASLVSRLCSVAHRKNTAILLTLHVNPALNSTKARGVLGSELWRKCESVLIIEKLADGVRRITTDYNLGKNRSASDTIAACFKWSDEREMHISCNVPSEKSGKTSLSLDEIIDQMSHSLKWSFTDLRALIINITGKSSRTAESRIRDLSNCQKINKNDDGTYSVNKNTIDLPEYIHD